MSKIKKDYYYNGNLLYKRYYNDCGVSHREDGPVYVEYDIDGTLVMEEWMIDGKFHRINGPAIIMYSKNRKPHLEKWIYKDKGEVYNNRVTEWIKENNFNSWEEMIESDFNRMWFEIL